jgi:hypothetical protein
MCQRRDGEGEYGKNTQCGRQAARLGKPAHQWRAEEKTSITRGGHCCDSVSGAMTRAAGCCSEDEWGHGCHAKADQDESQHREANMLNPQR